MGDEQSRPFKEANNSEPSETSSKGHEMDLGRQRELNTQETVTSTMSSANAHTLIVSDNNVISEILELILSNAGISSEREWSLTKGCELARSGRFQVVVTTSDLADGTWKLLVDLAGRYRPGFVVIVVADAFDARQWADALDGGLFDILDASHELWKVGEIVTRALWAAYLEGAGPQPILPSQIYA